MTRALSLLSLLFGLLALPVQAQPPAALQQELDALDAALFEPLFNRCELERMDALLHPQLEFLHDQAGRQDRAGFERATRQNLCSGQGDKPLRRLLPGTLESHPLYANGELYGAVQSGRHAFFLRGPDGRERPTSQARFVHTWLRVDGRWQLYRVLSYDHRPQ
ncbi:nuclear transport factor 2 family protein [Inhella sp.]|uniref:nuclear transport factor 2 family protein n=1 Tax=Inhella sp. TaxID=1921806 RepID=UPI0035ADD305